MANRHHEIGIRAICAYTGVARNDVVIAVESGDLAAKATPNGPSATHVDLDRWVRCLRIAEILNHSG